MSLRRFSKNCCRRTRTSPCSCTFRIPEATDVSSVPAPVKSIVRIDLTEYARHMSRPDSSEPARAIDTGTVVRMVGVPVSTLNHWVAKGLCRPSVLGPAGHRVARLWHPRDVVVVRAIKALRQAGCSLQAISKVQGLLIRHWGQDLDSSVLYFNGTDVQIVDDAEQRVISLMREPGQGVFNASIQALTLPLGAWVAEANHWADENIIDISRERRKRRARAAAHRLRAGT